MVQEATSPAATPATMPLHRLALSSRILGTPSLEVEVSSVQVDGHEKAPCICGFVRSVCTCPVRRLPLLEMEHIAQLCLFVAQNVSFGICDYTPRFSILLPF